MLIGRDVERDLLAEHLADARRGHGRVVVVQGEPGIGKTALLDDAAGHATDMTVLRCTGVESEIDLPHGGLHQLLAPVIGELDGLAGVHRAVIDGMWPTTWSSVTTAEPVITPGAVGYAVLAAWQHLASQRPLLVVVDDVHWLDGGSARAVLFAARRIATDPIAVLAARRDLDDTGPFARSGFPVLPVAGLAMDAVRDLLAGQGWSPPRRVVEVLTEHSGGNPLALLEVAASGDTERLPAMASMSKTVPLTDRLRDAFTDRLGTLPERTRRALVVAAADETGRHDLILGASARLGLGTDALAAAESARLIVVDTVAAHPESLRFRHPLMRSAVYHGAPFADRASAHEALATELADHDPARAAWHRALAPTGTDEQREQRAAALADQAASLRGGGGLAASSAAHQRAAQLTRSPGRRRRYLVAAAYDAWKAGDSARGRTLAEQAAATAAGASRAGPTDADDTDAALERLRGYMEWYAGDQAIAATRLADSADAPATDPGETATVLLAACDAAWQAGEIAIAQSLTDRLATDPGTSDYHRLAHLLAAALDDRLAPGDVPAPRSTEAVPADHHTDDPRRWMWLLALACRGPDLTTARDLGLQAVDRLRTGGMFSLLTVVLSRLVDVEYRLGRWEEGAAHAEEGLRHAGDAGHSARQADFEAHLARFAAVRGDDEAVRIHGRTALALAWRTRNRLAAARATWAEGLSALATGDHREAFERITAITGSGPSAHPDIARGATADLVEAGLRCGRIEAAEQAAADFADWSHGRTSPWVEIQVLRCQALLTAHVGDATADKYCETAAAAAIAAQLPFEQARIAVFHGEWLRRGRRPTEARHHLRTAVELFDRLGASHWADHARTQLRAVGGVTDHRPSDLAGRLTPQELQVARLAAQGLSNREIGSMLFLSPRTVGYHLYKLFPKLGIAGRTQLRRLDLG